MTRVIARHRTLFLAAALVLAVGLASTAMVAFGRDKTVLTAKEARTTARQFLAALAASDYERACDLLGRDFYRQNHVPDRAHCVSGLNAGMGRVAIPYRITRVSAGGGRATVDALVDGAPGKLLLVGEGDRYKVLAVDGA
jgi:hypothetical protein